MRDTYNFWPAEEWGGVTCGALEKNACLLMRQKIVIQLLDGR